MGPSQAESSAPSRFRIARIERGGSKPENLLELDVDNELDDAKERTTIRGYVEEIDDRLKRLNLISKERKEVLKDLKEKVYLSTTHSIGANIFSDSK